MKDFIVLSFYSKTFLSVFPFGLTCDKPRVLWLHRSSDKSLIQRTRRRMRRGEGLERFLLLEEDISLGVGYFMFRNCNLICLWLNRVWHEACCILRRIDQTSLCSLESCPCCHDNPWVQLQSWLYLLVLFWIVYWFSFGLLSFACAGVMRGIETGCSIFLWCAIKTQCSVF